MNLDNIEPRITINDDGDPVIECTRSGCPAYGDCPEFGVFDESPCIPGWRRMVRNLQSHADK